MGSLDFSFRGSKFGGRFTRDEIRELLDGQFSGINFSGRAREYFVRKLGTRRPLDGDDFNDAINEAADRNLITPQKAEKMKDAIKLPDKYNDHWK